MVTKSYLIKQLKARQVLDCKGRPVVEVDVITSDGVMGRAGASTGTSVGKNESFVLRDKNPSLYNGLSVYNAIRNIKDIIAPELLGMDVREQELIDRKMIELDGTKHKSKLGGNAIYAVSVANARAASAASEKSFYKYMAPQQVKTIPLPAFNMINGGTYGANTLAFQEFMVIPWKVSSIAESVRIGVEIFHHLGDVIKKHQNGRPAVMGNYSGYGAPSEDPFEIFDIINKAASDLGYEDKICYSMDCASSEIYDEEKDAYFYKGEYVRRDYLISIFTRLSKKYPIGFIEDCLHEEDFEGFSIANKDIEAYIIGDDLLCTNIERLRKALDMKAVKGMILKPNQVGTITEALETANFAQGNNLLIVGSGRAGGVLDDPVCELGISLGLPLIKTGAPRSGERTNSLNTLLRIAEESEVKLSPFNLKSIPGFLS